MSVKRLLHRDQSKRSGFWGIHSRSSYGLLLPMHGPSMARAFSSWKRSSPALPAQCDRRSPFVAYRLVLKRWGEFETLTSNTPRGCSTWAFLRLTSELCFARSRAFFHASLVCYISLCVEPAQFLANGGRSDTIARTIGWASLLRDGRGDTYRQATSMPPN